jgi:phosphopantetheine--protein transferase-like protein
MVYGIGVDIVSRNRVHEALKRNEKAFLKFVFTRKEIEYAYKCQDAVSHLSVFFAAKEAVLKTFGTGWKGGVRLTDIEVLHTSSGKPEINLLGNAKKIAQSLSVTKVLISLSFEDSYAIAYAVALNCIEEKP